MPDVIIDPKDKKYYVEKPDPNFNPERNMAIVYETLKESEEFFRKLEVKYEDELDNRIDILSSYTDYRFNRGTKDFKNYAGKRLYSELIGEKILSKYRALSSVDKLQGNTKVLL